MTTKTLEIAHKQLGWPQDRCIFHPPGPGPRVYAELAKRKLETALSRTEMDVRVGVLSANPSSDTTEAPLALVCDFRQKPTEAVLREAHRLAWSFSCSPMLVTTEPGLLRVWSCWKKPPGEDADLKRLLVQDLPVEASTSLSSQAARSLHWVELVSGNVFKEYDRYFQRNQSADQLMLENLKDLRYQLRNDGLPESVCHDLLARVMFVEFLFQRKDRDGNAALSKKVLCNMHGDGVLSRECADLGDILESRDDTYAFFHKLNETFNGDLFPGSGKTEKERAEAWKEESDAVWPKHLRKLAAFVRGDMVMRNRQRCLWPQYAFDVIPLEFISSIYEEFVTRKKSKSIEDKSEEHVELSRGVHYTPGHLVDFILDRVLPWNSKKWDIKILDPACGSGIFLVKAYQRLIHRWRKAHRQKPRAEDLRGLLENNLFGVDIEPEAVRVASFSLYLAMCDELEPKHVWQQVKFPQLRERRLINSDFFAEDKPGFRTDADAGTYDLVIGNAPWGYDSNTPEARQWATRDPDNVWEIPNDNIGALFLPKGVLVATPAGRVCMLQSAGAMLFNRTPTTLRFRRKLFSDYKVDEIANLSTLRFGLFKDAISPACIVTIQRTPPNGEPLAYICPKPTRTKQDDFKVIIEPHDVAWISPQEAAADPVVWTATAWGEHRDLALVKKLSQETTIEGLTARPGVAVRRGVCRGDKGREQPEILNMPILGKDGFPPDTFLFLNSDDLPRNSDPWTHSRDSTSMDAFAQPQMVIKQSWQQRQARFRAAIVQGPPAFCSRSYISVHVPKSLLGLLEGACLSLNSILAVYFTLLTSGRFASYIPEPNEKDLLRVPVPALRPVSLDGIKTFDDVDRRIRDAFGLKDAEWVLVQDLFEYTLRDFKGGADSPGRKPTSERGGSEPVLRGYCKYFHRVLKAGFGKDRHVSATIFQEPQGSSLPVRLVAIHLDAPDDGKVSIDKIDSHDLIERLCDLDRKFLNSRDNRKGGGILYRRVARIYDTMDMGGRKVPTVFLVKPDQIRYWTRSRGMGDADEVAADIMLWQGSATSASRSGKP